MSKPVKIAVTADVSKARRAFANLSNELGLTKLASGFKSLVKHTAQAVGLVATAAGGVGAKFTALASDFQQSAGAIDAIFKEHAGQVHAYAKDAANSVGLAKTQYNELAAVLATQLKNGGTSMEELGGKTHELIALGADMSAMFGGTTADAVAALSSALKGERNPIERYGVSLKQATIDAKAAELGFQKVAGSFSNEAQQAATLALIMEQTSDAHGAFARESDTLAGKMQRIKATLTNFATDMGGKLLPVVEKAAAWIAAHLGPALERLAGWIQTQAAPAVGRLAARFQTDVLPVLRRLVARFRADVLPVLQRFGAYIVGTVIPTVAKIARKLWAMRDVLLPIAAGITAAVVAFRSIIKVLRIARTVMAAFNAVMAINPIVLIVAAVVGLIAGLVLLYKKSATFRAFIDGIWQKIKSFAGWLADLPGKVGQWMGQAKDWIVTKWNEAVEWVKAVPGKIADALSSLGSKLKDKASQAWQSFIDGGKALWGAVTGFVSEWVGKILSGLASLAKSLWDAAKGAWQSFIDGGKALWGTVTGFVSEWVGKILSGLASLANSLWNTARDAFLDFVSGVRSIFGTITSTVASIPGKILSAIGYVGRLLWDTGKNVITGLLNGITNSFWRITGFVRSIPGKITSAIGYLGDLLWSAGKAVLDGLLAGLKAAWKPVQDFLNWVTDKIPDWKGPADKDAHLLTPAGKLIMKGLIAGLESQRNSVKRTLNSISGDIAATQFASPEADLPAYVNAYRARSAPQSVTIHVHALDATPEVGRRIAHALAQYDALNGGRR